MTEQVLETYHGNCHCGAFKFSVKLPELKQVFGCNCSICSKKGYLWARPSSDDLFVVEKGDGTLKDYLFGKKAVAHKVRLMYSRSASTSRVMVQSDAIKFCPKCGTPVMGQRDTKGPSIGVNVRTFRDFDEEKLGIMPHDGASHEPHYMPPNGSEVSDLGESTKCYRGSCHCGKVTFDLHSKPLEDCQILSCNCSICSRNAVLWIYPPKEDVELRGGDHLSIYQFASKAASHSFCSTCGVSIVNQFEPPEGTVVEFMEGKLPVNVRAINGIDFKALRVDKVDGKTLRGPPYEV